LNIFENEPEEDNEKESIIHAIIAAADFTLEGGNVFWHLSVNKHAMRREELQSAINEVRAVYAELAKRPVTRHCQSRTECCQFQLTGLTPQLTKGEALVAAKGFRASGRKEFPESTDGACPLLKRETGKCMIYADRPFGCRTHFCDAAGGPYSRKEVLDLIRRLEAVDQKLGGDGPRKIQVAVADALEEMR
jgi:Fe-S-cluster containining protein